MNTWKSIPKHTRDGKAVKLSHGSGNGEKGKQSALT